MRLVVGVTGEDGRDRNNVRSMLQEVIELAAIVATLIHRAGEGGLKEGVVGEGTGGAGLDLHVREHDVHVTGLVTVDGLTDDGTVLERVGARDARALAIDQARDVRNLRRAAKRGNQIAVDATVGDRQVVLLGASNLTTGRVVTLVLGLNNVSFPLKGLDASDVDSGAIGRLDHTAVANIAGGELGIPLGIPKTVNVHLLGFFLGCIPIFVGFFHFIYLGWLNPLPD